jgi:hypothetical protein
METTNTDNMLKTFFSEQKHEIADNGFSERVMLKLPKQADYSWIVGVFAALGMAISIYLSIVLGLVQHALTIIQHVPYYYLLGAVFFFPLVGSVFVFLRQDKHYRLI